MLRSLAARIESMMVIKDASTSEGTARTERYQQLRCTVSAECLHVSYGTWVLTRHDVVQEQRLDLGQNYDWSQEN